MVAVLLAKVREERITSAAGEGQITTLGRTTSKLVNNRGLYYVYVNTYAELLYTVLVVKMTRRNQLYM